MSVSFEDRDGVGYIQLDDGKANALSPELLRAFGEALDEAEESKAVVIAGRVGRFSAGFDLRIMMKGPDEALALVKAGAELLMRIYGFPRPVVAACTGHAVAGGALLLLSCDERVGAIGDFKVGLNETSVGMTLPMFGLELARDRLSPRHLTRATMGAHAYDPAGAVEAGYLDRIVDALEVENVAIADARRLSTLTSSAYAATKTGLRGAKIEHILEELQADLERITRG